MVKEFQKVFFFGIYLVKHDTEIKLKENFMVLYNIYTLYQMNLKR